MATELVSEALKSIDALIKANKSQLPLPEVKGKTLFQVVDVFKTYRYTAPGHFSCDVEGEIAVKRIVNICKDLVADLVASIQLSITLANKRRDSDESRARVLELIAEREKAEYDFDEARRELDISMRLLEEGSAKLKANLKQNKNVDKQLSD
jgi:hypothetical protein